MTVCTVTASEVDEIDRLAMTVWQQYRIAMDQSRREVSGGVELLLGRIPMFTVKPFSHRARAINGSGTTTASLRAAHAVSRIKNDRSRHDEFSTRTTKRFNSPPIREADGAAEGNDLQGSHGR